MSHFPHSPFIREKNTVTRVMLKVLLALVPGIAVYAWHFGIGILVHLCLCSCAALAAEAAMLKLRGKSPVLFLADLSAIVTAWLIALAFPPIAPWWLTVFATAFAIVVAKHLYGGLGQNLFNPAMVAYCAMIVAFPALMSQWPGPHQLGAATQLDLIFGGQRIVDAITSATPLDALRTGLHGGAHQISDILKSGNFGLLGATGLGSGWEWISLANLIGGLWLWQQRLITWHIPFAFLGGLGAISALFWLIDGQHFASPLFQLASGASMLGAFFILTDPVTAASTPRGKLLYGLGAALIVWLIRCFGAYPDGVAFATLLMNLCVPLIDMKNQPPVFGHKTGPVQKS